MLMPAPLCAADPDAILYLFVMSGELTESFVVVLKEVN